MASSRRSEADKMRWRQEKEDFVASVVKNVDKAYIRDQIMECKDEKDVELLIQYMIDDEGGAKANAKWNLSNAYEQENLEALVQHPPLFRIRDDYRNPQVHSVALDTRISNDEYPNDAFGGARRKTNFRNSSQEIRHTRQDAEEDVDVETRVMTQVVSLSEIFPSADPDYLQQRCWGINGHPVRYKYLVQELVEQGYPVIGSPDETERENTFHKTENTPRLKRNEIIDADKGDVDVEDQDCGICYSSIPVAEIICCRSGKGRHKYCKECVKRYAEEEIGQGRHLFRCPEVDCGGHIGERDLRRLLPRPVMEGVLQKRQQDEIESAGIEDLESCPFCDFKIIMPNKYDKVFICQNPQCLKDSCRLCKEENHIPKSCREALGEKQKDVRTTLENKMAEAMIRACVKCKKRFIIEAGCNKMKCPCGALMCYICKKAIDGYQHFTQHPDKEPHKCPLWSNSQNVHDKEVREAAAKAKEDIDPNVDLVHDPTKDL